MYNLGIDPDPKFLIFIQSIRIRNFQFRIRNTTKDCSDLCVWRGTRGQGPADRWRPGGAANASCRNPLRRSPPSAAARLHGNVF